MEILSLMQGSIQVLSNCKSQYYLFI